MFADLLGMPEEGLSNITSQALSGNAAALASSHLGNNAELNQMLKLAAEKNIKPWINVLPMKDAAKAIKAVEDNSVRYRSVLIQVGHVRTVYQGRADGSLGHRGLGARKVVTRGSETVEVDRISSRKVYA